MGVSLTVLAANDRFAIGALNNIAMQIWHADTPPVDGARLAVHAVQELNASQDDVHLLIVAKPGLRPPDPETRKLLSSIGQVEGIRSCAFVTHGGSGFWSATMRAVLNGMVFLVRPGFEVQTFSETESAAVWIAERAEIPSEQLKRALDDLMMRSALGKNTAAQT